LRRYHLILAGIALLGVALRIGAVLGGTALLSPTGYDDGVYYSASALLLRGVLPYGDFVFVHPPALLYVLATTSWLPDPAMGFAAARVLAGMVGGASIVLLGLIVARASTPAGGLVAALLYAVYPDAVIAERSPYLEPVLNLFCLIASWLWLSRDDGGKVRRPFVAGVMAGLACAVKFWAGVWVIAAVLAVGRRHWRDALRFVAGGAVAGIVALAPLALPAPRAFIEQTLRFQVSRPPDGVMEMSGRLRDIAMQGHRPATALALAALMLFVVRRRLTAAQRFFTIAMLLTVAGFLASSSYWNHYNSHLAASQCAVAGLGAAALVNFVPRRRGIAVAVLLIAIIAIEYPAVRGLARGMRDQSPELLTAAHVVREHVPRTARFFAFDPTWSLISGRLPDCCDGAPPVVDSYGLMLLNAVQSGAKFSDTGQAFRSGAVQAEVRARLAASQFVLLGGRGHWQLDEPDRAWFTSHFRCMNPEFEDQCVWERREQPAAPSPLESNLLQFGEGWWGREGLPPDTWRWMSGHAVVKLPPLHEPARLELAFELPPLPVPPVVTIYLGGQELARITATEPQVVRAFDVASADATQELILTTDRSVNPARDGLSGDTRDLALKLTRIVWRPAAAGATSSRR